VWGVGVTALGYSAGAAYKKVAGEAGRAALIALAVLLLAALAVWHHRRGRKNRPPAEGGETEGGETEGGETEAAAARGDERVGEAEGADGPGAEPGDSGGERR